MQLAIATPMFGGQCTATFNRSVMALQRAIRREGGTLDLLSLGNESLIQRARNALVWNFLEKTEASHLLWCDADQGFRVDDIARMVAADKDIIVGAVPMKMINWPRVAKAVKDGVPPERLERYTGVFNIVHLPGNRRVSANEPFEIERGGTGLMLIKRGVFERLAPSCDSYLNKLPGDAMPPGVRVVDFYPTPIVNDDLQSEDFGFCVKWRALGGSIWCAPWCEIEHVGPYTFRGSLKDQYAQ